MFEEIFYKMVKLILTLIMFSGCLQIVTGKSRGDDISFCTDTQENLMNAFDNLRQLHYDVSFTQGLYVPQDNLNTVDQKSYQDLTRSCRLSSRTDDGFYRVLYKMFNVSSGSTFENIPKTCPWVSVSNYDVDRLPVEIPEAQCVCNRCLQRVPRGSNVFRYVPRLGRCKQVMKSLTVLRRHCNTTSGYYEYIADTEKISVGCTCTRPYFVN